MANVSRANGLRPVKYLNGSCWNGQLSRFYVPAADATAIGVGDPVKLSGLADTNGVPGVTKAAVGDPIIGIVTGVEVNYANLNAIAGRPASTAMYVLVPTDPATVFEAQVSGTIAAADVGLNVNHVDGGVSAVTGQSGVQMDGTTKAVTATLTFKIVGFSTRVDNEVGNASAKVLVKINNHQLASGTGTLGVA